MPSPAPTATATVTVISRVTETALPSTTTTPSRGTRYYEVDDDDNPNFASPSGRIWCVIYTNSATCMTDFNDQDSLPKVRNCGESGWTGPPNVVLLAEGKATMMCFNDMAADPRRGSPYNTQWVEGYGEWVKVNLKGEQMELASLPYGKAMRAGTVACTSEGLRSQLRGPKNRARIPNPQPWCRQLLA